MNLTDELERLAQLHNSGTLSDEEFALAKSKLLSQSAPTESAEQADPSATPPIDMSRSKS